MVPTVITVRHFLNRTAFSFRRPQSHGLSSSRGFSSKHEFCQLLLNALFPSLWQLFDPCRKHGSSAVWMGQELTCLPRREVISWQGWIPTRDGCHKKKPMIVPALTSMREALSCIVHSDPSAYKALVDWFNKLLFVLDRSAAFKVRIRYRTTCALTLLF